MKSVMENEKPFPVRIRSFRKLLYQIEIDRILFYTAWCNGGMLYDEKPHMVDRMTEDKVLYNISESLEDIARRIQFIRRNIVCACP